MAGPVCWNIWKSNKNARTFSPYSFHYIDWINPISITNRLHGVTCQKAILPIDTALSALQIRDCTYRRDIFCFPKSYSCSLQMWQHCRRCSRICRSLHDRQHRALSLLVPRHDWFVRSQIVITRTILQRSVAVLSMTGVREPHW